MKKTEKTSEAEEAEKRSVAAMVAAVTNVTGRNAIAGRDAIAIGPNIGPIANNRMLLVAAIPSAMRAAGTLETFTVPNYEDLERPYDISFAAAYDIDAMREGLDRSEIDEVAALADLTKKEMATLLGRSERNRYYATSKPLSLLESEHLINLKLLFSQGLNIFDGNIKAFSSWLRTPKQALAVPETGFPIIVPEDYKQPSISELFAPHSEEENRLAIQKNMAYNRQRAQEQTKPFPTPLSILDSPTGLRLVSDILGRIDAGVYN